MRQRCLAGLGRHLLEPTQDHSATWMRCPSSVFALIDLQLASDGCQQRTSVRGHLQPSTLLRLSFPSLWPTTLVYRLPACQLPFGHRWNGTSLPLLHTSEEGECAGYCRAAVAGLHQPCLVSLPAGASSSSGKSLSDFSNCYLSFYLIIIF